MLSWAEFYTWTNSPQVPTSGDAYYSKLDVGTGRWSAPVNLSNTGQVKSYEWYVVGIDTDPYGNVYVVYVNGTQLMLRVFSGGAWGAPFLVGSGPGAGGVDSARIAADAQGNIFICWWDNDWGIVYSRARVGGTWEGVVQLSKPVRSKFPEIAVGPNLVYCVFMDAQTGYSYQAVYTVRARTYGAGWSAPKRVSSSGEPEEHPAVKVDSADVAHVIYTPWFESDGTRSVRYVSGTAAGWSAPVDIGSRGASTILRSASGATIYMPSGNGIMARSIPTSARPESGAANTPCRGRLLATCRMSPSARRRTRCIMFGTTATPRTFISE